MKAFLIDTNVLLRQFSGRIRLFVHLQGKQSGPFTAGETNFVCVHRTLLNCGASQRGR